MEVLEAIRKRRTARVPFNEKSVPEDVIRIFLDISSISPSGDPVSWRLVPVDDEAKPELARIVQEDFGDYFQKDSRRFKQVFSKYPVWLRFSEAKDGIRLSGFPKIARHFYRFALGPGFGTIFGKLGVMNAEIRSYCRNIIANPVLFGVFLDRRVSSAAIAPIINAGSMLQNLRLTALLSVSAIRISDGLRRRKQRPIRQGSCCTCPTAMRRSISSESAMRTIFSGRTRSPISEGT